MNSIKDFEIYLNSKIKNIEENYNLDELTTLKNKLLENIVLFDQDIEKIDLELLKQIFDEYYNAENSIKNYELFLEIREFSDELNNHIDEPQIQVCLKYITKFKELFNNKIQDVEKEISEVKKVIKELIQNYKKVLNYFENGELIRILSSEELENLFSFLTNININSEQLYNLIVDITAKNLELYAKKRERVISNRFDQIKRNSAKISKLINTVINQEEIVEVIEEEKEEPELVDDIIEVFQTDDKVIDKKNVDLPKGTFSAPLTEEEQQIYNNILNIYDNLKKENINLSLVVDVLDLIKDDDFTLEDTRKDLYGPIWCVENIWGVILLDLEKNLLPNFQKHKSEIIEIFKYIIDFYNKNFISGKEFILQIPVIENVEEINVIIDEYKLLSDETKKYVLSMKSVADVYGIDSLKNYSLNIPYNKLCYYLYLENIKELFESYNEKIREDVANDKNLADILISEITDIKKEILELLEKITQLKEQEKDNEPEPEEEVSLSYENLLLFIPNSNENNNIHDTLIENIETLKKNYRDDYKEYVSQGLLAIDERLLKTPFSQIRNLSQVGGKRGKTKNKNGILENDKNKPKLDEYNVFRYKPRIGTGARVCYMILKISENNKERLKKYFNMQTLGDICLVLNLDASVKDEKEYVKRTHDILLTKEIVIKKLIDIFANDFTEENFDIAISLVEKSMAECSELKKQFCKSEQKSIGEDDD